MKDERPAVQRLLAVVVGEGHAFDGDAVDVGRLVAHQPMGIGADVRLADVVAPDDQDVGLRCTGSRLCRRGQRQYDAVASTNTRDENTEDEAHAVPTWEDGVQHQERCRRDANAISKRRDTSAGMQVRQASPRASLDRGETPRASRRQRRTRHHAARALSSSIQEIERILEVVSARPGRGGRRSDLVLRVLLERAGSLPGRLRGARAGRAAARGFVRRFARGRPRPGDLGRQRRARGSALLIARDPKLEVRIVVVELLAETRAASPELRAGFFRRRSIACAGFAWFLRFRVDRLRRAPLRRDCPSDPRARAPFCETRVTPSPW